MRKNANTEARRFLSWRPPYGSSLECVRADSNKLINMTDTYSAGGKGWLELDSTSRSHGTTLSRIPSSDIERTGLWRVIAGCIMYRRLSFSLSGVIFREKSFSRRRRIHWIHGNTVHGQFLHAYCHALLSAESTAITEEEKDEQGRKAATGGYNRLVNLPAFHCLLFT